MKPINSTKSKTSQSIGKKNDTKQNTLPATQKTLANTKKTVKTSTSQVNVSKVNKTVPTSTSTVANKSDRILLEKIAASAAAKERKAEKERTQKLSEERRQREVENGRQKAKLLTLMAVKRDRERQEKSKPHTKFVFFQNKFLFKIF